jgi:hypothetical protein
MLLGTVLDPEVAAFYRDGLLALRSAEIPFLVGGAYALERYTGIARYTKDLDVFLRLRDMPAALAALDKMGCRTERTYPHWLAKAYKGEEFIDLIYSSGNGIALVDDAWFEHAAEGEVLGVPALLCPPEEMIWSKAFLMERERFDGADVAHLLAARGSTLSWPRLMERFGAHWRVLLAHLVLFGFVYPSERSLIPPDVMGALLNRLQSELLEGPQSDRVCLGTLVSRAQYLVDVENWGFRDARLAPEVRMTEGDIAEWTRAISGEDRPTAGDPPVVGDDGGHGG